MKADFSPPNGEKRVLLHACCAPCCCETIETLAAAGVECTAFFYNPNIQPREEYETRKREVIRFCQKTGVPFVNAEYDVENWRLRVKGLENEPERGRRCTACFNLRMERTARHAFENGFRVFAASLGLSRWKDLAQVNRSGQLAAAQYAGLTFWVHDWRKKGGAERAMQIAKQEQFYRQNYCGCASSRRG